MDSHELRQLLEQVRSGAATPETAALQIRQSPLADLGFAKVDLDRQLRCGFPEVIFAEGKTPEQVADIIRRLKQAGQNCLATRVSAEQARHLEAEFPKARYNPVGRTFWLPDKKTAAGVPAADQASRAGVAKVAVITAGTSDLPVAEEAADTARAMGCEVELLADVGVAGIHRLLSNHSRFIDADAVVVAAGMEGALPSVVGGLVDCPVIAIPTSVGYGASFGGVAALLSMLSSCAANVTVVNIDSGFKGGYVAALIARRLAQARQGGEG